MAKKPKGAREWTPKSCNVQFGCWNGCKYCWACMLALQRGKKDGKITSFDEWVEAGSFPTPPKYIRQVKESTFPKDSWVMFPSTHDTFPENYDLVWAAMNVLLSKGDSILFVSKPRLPVIENLTDDLLNLAKVIPGLMERIEFRFTIGTNDQEVLDAWELHTSPYQERLQCLKLAHEQGFKTSISIEPYLSANLLPLFQDILPHVVGEIWIGAMNYIPKMKRWGMPILQDADLLYTHDQMDSLFHNVVDTYPGVSHVKWKDSFQEALGITSNGKSANMPQPEPAAPFQITYTGTKQLTLF